MRLLLSLRSIAMTENKDNGNDRKLSFLFCHFQYSFFKSFSKNKNPYNKNPDTGDGSKAPG